jgi:hypothetical protein
MNKKKYCYIDFLIQFEEDNCIKIIDKQSDSEKLKFFQDFSVYLYRIIINDIKDKNLKKIITWKKDK